MERAEWDHSASSSVDDHPLLTPTRSDHFWVLGCLDASVGERALQRIDVTQQEEPTIEVCN